ncbi:MAG: FHA domain-containing protein [Bryobacteraceae bacterium]
MGLYQTLYYMSLAGGTAGLLAWALAAAIAAALSNQPEVWVSDLLAVLLLGALVGGLGVAFSDHYSGQRIKAKWVFFGVLSGMMCGGLAELIQLPITARLGEQAPILTRVIAWLLAGSLIGLGLGLRWIGANRTRAAHGYVGGLAGGVIGGLVFAGLSQIVPDVAQAAGFVALGAGICFGVTLAPILLKGGLLMFVSSGDPRAQAKYGRGKKEWELRQGEMYGVGSLSGEGARTKAGAESSIFIPDAAIAPHHAVVFGKEGRFYVARHAEAGGQAGLARFVLRVRGKTVTNSQELRDNDDILVGRTALKFTSRKREQ